jgi:hypothetical protein
MMGKAPTPEVTKLAPLAAAIVEIEALELFEVTPWLPPA